VGGDKVTLNISDLPVSLKMEGWEIVQDSVGSDSSKYGIPPRRIVRTVTVVDTIILFTKGQLLSGAISMDCIYGVINGKINSVQRTSSDSKVGYFRDPSLASSYKEFVRKLNLLMQYKTSPIRPKRGKLFNEELLYYESLFGKGGEKSVDQAFYRMGASILLAERLNRLMSLNELKVKRQIKTLVQLENFFEGRNHFNNIYGPGALDVRLQSERDFEIALSVLKKADSKKLETKTLVDVIEIYLFSLQQDSKKTLYYSNFVSALQKRKEYHATAIEGMKYVEDRFGE
jgi:hypothetical protein